MLKQRRQEIKALFTKRKIWCFQHDSAPPHSPLNAKRYIRHGFTSRCLPHPPQSPDLNHIELIWAQMKSLVEGKRPRSKKELLEAIMENWEEISLGTIRKCIDDLYLKMNKVIAKNGDLL